MHQPSKCANCGLSNYAGAVNCRRCSVGLNVAYASPVAVAYPSAHQTAPEMLGKREIITVAVAFVVAFFALLGIVNYHPKPDVSQVPAVAPALPATPEEIGFYGDYRYSFQRQGEKVAALFQPKMLPHSDVMFIAATRQIISQAFSEDVSASPTLVGKLIKFTGPKHVFMVTMIKEGTGEIHTLVIERN